MEHPGVRLPVVVPMADGVVAALKHDDTGPAIILKDSPVAEATKTPPHDGSRYGLRAKPSLSRHAEPRQV